MSEIHTTFLFKMVKERNLLKDLGADGRVM
jgi:hypothetical protein